MADTPTPKNQPTLPAQAGEEIGKSGTFLFLGFISAEEYNRNLVGKYGLQVYDTMRRSDATVHASLMVCKNPIIGANWDIEPASDDPADEEIANFVRRELFNRKIMWQDVVREALTCLDFGHSVFEKVYEPCEYEGQPRIGLAKLGSRKQRSIMRWAQSDGSPGITQIVPSGAGNQKEAQNSSPEINIPRDKLIYVINEREGQNYEGISLLRFAYKPWKIKDSLEIMHAIALERMSLGIPVVTKGQNNETADESELAKVRTALRQLRNNEDAYLEIPSSLNVSFLDMKANSTKDILPTIQYQDRQITLSVLAQFLELGSSGKGGSSGSRAVSEDHSQLFIKSLDAVARTVQQPFQEDLVKQLVDLNYSSLPNGYPKLVYSNVDDDDAVAVSTAVNQLMAVGAINPDKDLENRLRAILNLPAMPESAYESYDGDAEPSGGATEPGDNTKAIEEAKTMPTQKTGQPTIAARKKAAIAKAKPVQAELLDIILKDN